MSNLANQLARQETEDVARGIRLLLAAPLLTAAHDADGFDLIRRRREPIARWFDYYCGWRLSVEPRLGYARLAKVTDRPDASRPARRSRGGRQAFDRRRYTLLCVAAAELLAGPVTTIGLLADRLAQATAVDTDVPTFDPTRRSERSAYVDALSWLESRGAIRPVDGSTDAYLEHADAKVLYQVDTTLLVRLLSAPTPPSRLDLPPRAAEDPQPPQVSPTPPGGSADGAPGAVPEPPPGRLPDLPPDLLSDLLSGLLVERRYGDARDPDASVSDTQRNLWLRHSIMRRLMDDPVVYRTDLTDAQRGYLASPTGRRIIHQGVAQAGCVLEERAEGLLVVDPDAIATDMRFPDDASHARVAALFLLDRLTAAGMSVSQDELVSEAERLLDRFPSWARAYRSEGGAQRLASDGTEVLCAFGLARAENGSIAALPAAARYLVGPIRDGQDHDGQDRAEPTMQLMTSEQLMSREPRSTEPLT